MTTIYLCIGTMKTGTTAIQSFLRNNPLPLKEQGFCYPSMDAAVNNRNGHFLIFQSEEEDPQKKEAEYRHVREIGYHKLQALAKEYPNIILSEELIWHHFHKHKDFWKNVIGELDKIGCQLKVIVYLRRQDQLIQSLWKQGVKSGAKLTCSFEDYIRTKRYAYFPLDYYSQLQKIESSVGKENMFVRVYENGQYEGSAHTLISDFMHIIGLQMTEGFVQKDAVKNPSLNGNFIEMKRIMNGLPEYRHISNFVERPMVTACVYQQGRSENIKESLFTYEEQIKFLGQYAESNCKVAKEFLGREDGILFREPIEELPVYNVDHNMIYEDLLIFMMEMFCAQQHKIEHLEAKLQAQKRRSFLFRIKKRLKKIYTALKRI